MRNIENQLDILDFLFNPSNYFRYEDETTEELGEILEILNNNTKDRKYFQNQSKHLKLALNSLIEYMGNQIEIYIPFDLYKTNDLYIKNPTTKKTYIVEIKHRTEEYPNYLFEYKKYEELNRLIIDEQANDAYYLNTFDNGNYVIFSVNMLNKIIKDKVELEPNFIESYNPPIRKVIYLKSIFDYKGREIENFKFQLLYCNYYTKNTTDFENNNYKYKECLFIPTTLDLKKHKKC